MVSGNRTGQVRLVRMLTSKTCSVAKALNVTPRLLNNATLGIARKELFCSYKKTQVPFTRQARHVVPSLQKYFIDKIYIFLQK